MCSVTRCHLHIKVTMKVKETTTTTNRNKTPSQVMEPTTNINSRAIRGIRPRVPSKAKVGTICSNSKPRGTTVTSNRARTKAKTPTISSNKGRTTKISISKCLEWSITVPRYPIRMTRCPKTLTLWIPTCISQMTICRLRMI